MARSPRSGVRIPIELPIKVRWKNRTGKKLQVQGKTGNMSGNGLFMTVPLKPGRATALTITVQLPVEVTHSPLQLLCKGRVVNWKREGGRVGVSAVIDAYELRPTHHPA